MKALTVPDVQPIPEAEHAQVNIALQPSDMASIPGFGWVECQLPGKITCAEDMYENSNKIDIMG